MNVAVIFAGGAGRRMNTGGTPKQFLEFRGKPIIVYTLELFDSHPEIDAIAVACIEDRIPQLNQLIARFGLQKVRAVTAGGETGQDSIRMGLEAAAAFAPRDSVVLVHDGVRPLINHTTISDNIRTVREQGSCITCVPAIETLIVRNDDGTDYIPPRRQSLIARAPQSFRLDEILQLQERAVREGRHDFIDCCSMMNHYGHKLHYIEGPMENIKITTPTDFFMFKAIMDIKENQQIFGF